MARRVTRRRQQFATILAVAAVALAGCGVPGQDRPDVIDHADVPFRLTEERPPTSVTSTTVNVSPDEPQAGP
jgi:hypothetical protein